MRLAIAGASGVVGRHVVRAASERGHTAVPLSRSHGVDLTTGDGLTDALEGVQAIIDVTNAGTPDEAAATAFFTAVAGTLQRAAATSTVRHVVTLSIVGIDRFPFGYYAAKLAHERAAEAAAVGSTILRATQFHEFPAQQLAATQNSGIASIFDVRVRTIAARTVADDLVHLAENAPTGRAQEIAGPDEASLVDLARSYAARHAPDLTVVPDAETMAQAPDDLLLPQGQARIVGPSFDDWLTTDDAKAVWT